MLGSWAGTGSPARRDRTCRRDRRVVCLRLRNRRGRSRRAAARTGRGTWACRRSRARRPWRTQPCSAARARTGFAVGAAVPSRTTSAASGPEDGVHQRQRVAQLVRIAEHIGGDPAHQVRAQGAADREHEQERRGDLGAHVVGHDGLERGVLRSGADADDAGVERWPAPAPPTGWARARTKRRTECAPASAHSTTRWLASVTPRLASRSASQPPNSRPAGARISSAQPW